MFRILTVFFFSVLFFTGAYSQQDPQFSHFMFNNMSINPGYAGSSDEISAALIHRQQWMGLEGAPTTSAMNINAPFKLFNKSHGVGLSIINDAWGFNKDLGMNLSYAYRISMNNGAGKLGIGISGGFKNEALDVKGGWKTPVDGSIASTDANIPKENESEMTYDLGLGVFYKTENMYIGLSSTHITQSSIKYEKAEVTLQRHYYITAGYNFILPNPSYEIQPSVLITSDATASKLDLNTLVVYNKKVWGGVTFKPGISITGMAGIDLFGGVRVGYAYEYAFTDLRKQSTGSHELMLTYGFSIIKEKLPHKYRSIRFL